MKVKKSWNTKAWFPHFVLVEVFFSLLPSSKPLFLNISLSVLVTRPVGILFLECCKVPRTIPWLLPSDASGDPRPKFNNQKCLQTLPNVPWGQDPPWLRVAALNWHNAPILCPTGLSCLGNSGVPPKPQPPFSPIIRNHGSAEGCLREAIKSFSAPSPWL